MTLKKWIDPNEIYLAKAINPRPMNQGFIESLRESMEVQGFLPQYPVKVFEAERLVNIETDLPYACVSGMHRTTAAQLVELDQILCEIYTGDDDAFIEAMMIDNFEYDPAQNSELGQVFSQREKRKACTRLLYLPKFLRMTDSALAEAWHTGATNIRRWRQEVIASLDKASPNGGAPSEGDPTFPESLSRVGITPDRLQELKTINDSREREDADGNTVKVRTAPREMSDAEKREFWDQIRDDTGWYNEGWLKAHGIEDFDYVRECVSKRFSLNDSGSQMYKRMKTQQLRQLHGWILSDDPEFIAGCKAFKVQREALSTARGELRKECEQIQKWLLSEFVQGNEYSQEYKDCKASFIEAAHNFGYTEYTVESYDFPGGGSVEELTEKFKEYFDIVHTVVIDIRDEVPWVVEFRHTMKKKSEETRKKLISQWLVARSALTQAFDAYPRNIALGAFCYAMADEYYESADYHKLLTGESPSKRVHNDTIQSQTKYFKRATKDLQADEKWVRAIAEEPSGGVEVSAGTADTPEPQSEFTITAEDLHAVALNDIFQHVAGRVICVETFDEDEVMQELATVLGKASRGIVGTQLHLLMKFAIFLTPENNIEGREIEKEDRQ